MALKEEINILKKHEKFVMNMLNGLESRSRRNNLIFRGWKSGQTSDFSKRFLC